MRRWLTSLLLIFCLGWQSLAYAGAGVLVSEGEEMLHEILHFEGAAHHHDDHGGGFHQDDSAASTQHAIDDACLFAPAIPSDATLSVPGVQAGAPEQAGAVAPPPPFLSGPERPPKTLP
ncbi:hypothetical protein ACQ859_03345 [Roseateles chitinivorans]|uniref:hypothetical protein n=1 Tax=Roseateles chitinivorans TaxID=2917965 RepID=UPI002638C092|nr:hypothetical protein [uncultured Roseateles sp.]